MYPAPPSVLRKGFPLLLQWRIRIRYARVLPSFYDSLRWVAQKFWTWSVVGVLATAVFGAGVNAMYSDSYIAAATLYCFAFITLLAKTISWEDVRRHEHRKAVTVVVVLLEGLLFSVCLLWVKHTHVHALAKAPLISTEIAAEVAKEIPRQHDVERQPPIEQLPALKTNAKTHIGHKSAISKSAVTKPCQTPFHPDMFFAGNSVDNGTTAYQADATKRITGVDNTVRNGSAMFQVKKLGTGNFENSTTVGNSTMLKSERVDTLNVKNSTAYGDTSVPNVVAHHFNVADWFDFLERHEDLVAGGKSTDSLETTLRQKLEVDWKSLPRSEIDSNREELYTVLKELRNSTFNTHYRDWPPSFVDRPCN